MEILEKLSREMLEIKELVSQLLSTKEDKPSKEIVEIKKLVSQLLLDKSDKPLTLDEASIYTGRSKSDLYKRTSKGEIPHYKPSGKVIYFDKKELDQWLLANRVKPISEIENTAINYVSLKKGENSNVTK